MPLFHIFNQSFVTGKVPSKLKIAKMVPIFKAGSKKIFDNYRPISILPPISKILEKIVYKRLVNFLDRNDILYEHQYGFRSNQSTIHPVIHLMKDIAEANDKITKDVTLALFVDLSKAFDTINHNIVLNKLQYYGIRGLGCTWFENYLSQRQQYTEVHNHKSTLKQILTGVPQGSVLGPALFLPYINDIKSTILNVLSFADDTTAYYSGPFNKSLFDIVSRELGNLYNWLCANKLSLNIKKTNICMFSPPNSKYVIGNNFISLKNGSE